MFEIGIHSRHYFHLGGCAHLPKSRRCGNSRVQMEEDTRGHYVCIALRRRVNPIQRVLLLLLLLWRRRLSPTLLSLVRFSFVQSTRKSSSKLADKDSQTHCTHTHTVSLFVPKLDVIHLFVLLKLPLAFGFDLFVYWFPITLCRRSSRALYFRKRVLPSRSFESYFGSHLRVCPRFSSNLCSRSAE